MYEDLHAAMKAHALAAYPGEACGVVLGTDGSFAYCPLADVADRSRPTFDIDPTALRRLAGDRGAALAAVIHSHPEGPDAEGDDIDPLLLTPSAAEMRSQLAVGVPFGIVPTGRSRAMDPFWFGDQVPVPPLLYRPFRHGVTDCYSLIRDWYRVERKVVLREFPRDWDWWLEGGDLYGKGFAQAGFRPIDGSEAREGDGVLFRIRSKVPNHAGLLMRRGWLLHHPASTKPYDLTRVSRCEPLGNWKRLATHWVRHYEPDR